MKYHLNMTHIWEKKEKRYEQSKYTKCEKAPCTINMKK